MASYKVIDNVDFKDISIKDKNGYWDKMQNYAPKVGEFISGEEDKGYYIGDNKIVEGILFPIKTNGENSTQGQISIQVIPFRLLQKVDTSAGASGTGITTGEYIPNPGNEPTIEDVKVDIKKSRLKIAGLAVVLVVTIVLIITLGK